MSRKIKQIYNSFNREILKTFMTEQELAELDKKYNEYKVRKYIDKLEKVSGIKIEIKK